MTVNNQRQDDILDNSKDEEYSYEENPRRLLKDSSSDETKKTRTRSSQN